MFATMGSQTATNMIYRHLYNLTSKLDCVHEEGIIAIKLLSADDERFGFGTGLNLFSYMKDIGQKERGSLLCISLTGVIKSTQQFDPNFVMGIIPLT